MIFREKIGQALLKRKLKSKPSRKIEFSGVQHMKHIGILFDATSFDNYKAVLSFDKEMRKLGAKVSILGYQHSKRPTGNYVSDLHNGFINRKDFNWYNACKSQFVSDFIVKEFDALFVISPQNYFPIHYVSLLSLAKFKVGIAGQNQSDFDLMLEIPTKTPFNDQIHYMWKYIEMLSKSSVAI
jgi:hypothetical protein